MNIASYQALAESRFAPSNQLTDEDFRYEVRKAETKGFLSRGEVTIAECDSYEDAIAFVGNLEEYKGRDLNIYRLPRNHEADEQLVECAEWDEEVLDGRYLSE